MPLTPTNTYSGAKLIPLYPKPDPIRKVIKLPASIHYAAGTMLGALIGNNEVQIITINATGGTFAVEFGDSDPSAAIAYNASAATVQTALEAQSTIADEEVVVTKLRSRWSLALAPGTDGGSFGLAVTIGGVRAIVPNQAWNVSAANLQTAIRALTNGPGLATVALGSEIYTIVFPASVGDVLVEVVNDTTNDGGVWENGIVVTETDLGGVYRIEFQNGLGRQNVAALVTDPALLTGGAGTAAVTTQTAGSAGTPGTFKAYDPDNSDGSQIAVGPLEHECATDASGNITHGAVAGTMPYGSTYLTTTMFVGGVFATTDLVGLDENAVSVMNAKLVGSVDSGELYL